MKLLFSTILFLIFCSSSIISQNPIRFDTIIVFNSDNVEQVKENASVWMKRNNSNYQSDSNTMSSQGVFYHKYGSSLRWGNHYGNISYNVLAEFKNDRVRISAGNFTHKAENSMMGISLDYGLMTDSDKPASGLSKKYLEEIKKACKVKAYEIFISLSEAIDKKEDQW